MKLIKRNCKNKYAYSKKKYIGNILSIVIYSNIPSIDCVKTLLASSHPVLGIHNEVCIFSGILKMKKM